MNSIITMAIAMAPSMFTNLMVRMNRNHQVGKISKGPQSRSILPPEVLSNLPQVDRVDIRAMFKKWED
jgi:hypothetical protein